MPRTEYVCDPSIQKDCFCYPGEEVPSWDEQLKLLTILPVEVKECFCWSTCAWDSSFRMKQSFPFIQSLESRCGKSLLEWWETCKVTPCFCSDNILHVSGLQQPGLTIYSSALSVLHCCKFIDTKKSIGQILHKETCVYRARSFVFLKKGWWYLGWHTEV